MDASAPSTVKPASTPKTMSKVGATRAGACSRRAEPGMKVGADSDRARHSRKLVLELLASSADLSTTPHVAGWIREYTGDYFWAWITAGGLCLAASIMVVTIPRGRDVDAEPALEQVGEEAAQL